MPHQDEIIREILNDVRLGMEDSTIMEKYGLSSLELEEVLQKLVEAGLLRRENGPGSPRSKRTINAKAIVGDIQSGMSKDDLMAKYHLSPKMLEYVCKKLLDARAIEQHHLNASSLQATVVEDIIRGLQRYYLDFDVAVYEDGHPEIQGRLRDITEQGVGLEGIESGVDSTQKFVVLGDLFGEIAPFEFQARCKWFKQGGPDDPCGGGFEITGISDKDLRELRKLIDLVTLRG
jgi:uncharacterized protein (DUF433 family)